MSELQPASRSSRLSLEGTGGWLLVGAFAVFVVGVTRWGYQVPRGLETPFSLVWAVLSIAAAGLAQLLIARRRPDRPRLRPVEALAILAVAAMVLSDLNMMWQPLRDLAIYLRAGQHFLDGNPVYSQTPLAVQPADRSQYPFLYPPLTLPLFGLMATLPVWLARTIWVLSSMAAGLAALRILGVPWRWLPVALLWPPLFEGLWVGNVAVPALLLFAVGPWLGGALVLGGTFKPYATLASLWLVRERRWVAILAGLGSFLVLGAIALPLTGLDLWSKWIGGLQTYQRSQDLLPGLYGIGLGRFVPFVVFVALAVAALALALRAGGRESLARLGTATVVASPSLFGHGLLLAAASMLSLRSVWLWLTIGILSTPDGGHWWLAVALIVASWLVPALRLSEDEVARRRAAGATGLLDANAGAWPRIPRSRPADHLPSASPSPATLPVELARSEPGSAQAGR